MAMINCHECNRKVSDMAQACPECGSPVSAIVSALKVRIYYPSKASSGFGAVLESLDTAVKVSDEYGNEMARLKPGDTYTFAVSEPIKIGLSKGLTIGKPSETVYPGDVYEIKFGMLLSNLKLVKVDSL